MMKNKLTAWIGRLLWWRKPESPEPVMQRLAHTSRTLEGINALEESLLKHEQIDIPTAHDFAPGIYMRSIIVPAQTFIIGHFHKTEFLNLMVKGRATVWVNGRVVELKGPCVVKSDANTRKMAFVHEDMIWTTVHPNADDTQDVAVLEDRLLIKTDAWLRHHQQLENVKQPMDMVIEAVRQQPRIEACQP